MRKQHPALALFAAGALGIGSAMAFAVPSVGYVGRSAAPTDTASYLWCALALCFAWLLWYVFIRKNQRLSWSGALFALLFGVANTLGGMLNAYDSWAMLAKGTAAALAALRCIGQAVPMAAGLTWLHQWLSEGVLLEREPAPGGGVPGPLPTTGGGKSRVRAFASDHPTLLCLLILALCWSPFLIAFFPGTVCWDLGEMFAQYQGLRELTTWHSILLTWLFGGLVDLGRRLAGSDNIGPALYMLLQTAALAYAFTRVLRLLRRLRVRFAARAAALAFFALTPFWGGYAQFISKDTLYTAAMLLFSLCVTETLLCRERGERPSPGTLWGLFAWGLLTSLIRTNGLYVVLPSALALVLLGGRGKTRLLLSAALAGAVGAALLFTNVLVPALGVKDETASGLYSVCFQQSARVLRDHGEQVSPEEYAEIDRVLDAAALPALYEPWISDPVKYTFRYYGQGKAAEREALERYMVTWRAMLTRFPLTYAEAFFAGNVGYYTFTPKFEGASYNNQAGNRLVFETYDVGKDAAYLHTVQAERWSGARELLALYARGWRHIPLLSLTYCCAAYTWLLVGAGLSLARQRRARLLCAFVPALMTLGVCALSPVNDYFRYFLPIVAMTVPLLGLSARAPERA